MQYGSTLHSTYVSMSYTNVGTGINIRMQNEGFGPDHTYAHEKWRIWTDQQCLTT